MNEENFEKALVLHAVKKIPVQNWINDRNQFLKPRVEPDQEFALDCIVWSLFAYSNETTSLRNVDYRGKVYQIKNNFFPFLIDIVKKWNIKDPDFILQLGNDQDRYVANWLKQKKLSVEAQMVYEKGKEVYQEFYSNLNRMRTHYLKIASWDAGWYQIRRCLSDHNIGVDIIEELKHLNQAIADKILFKIEEFGFLDKDEVY